jgi:Flp pilus assembly protein TadD
VLLAHRVPLLGVETDLLGDSVPAARALAAGRLQAEAFQFRGPGYPLMLAGAARLTHGDEFLAARLANVAAAAGAAGAAWLLFRSFLGPLVGLAVLLGLWANPVFVRAGIEAGTDMPALALALATTHLVTRGGGWRTGAAAGLAAGCAVLTRYNMVFLAPAGIAGLLLARSDARRIAAFVAGLVVPIGGWTVAHLLATGGLPDNRNYVNVAYEVYGQGMTYDRFWLTTGNALRSFADVFFHDPARFALHVGSNVLTRWVDDAHQLMPVWIGAPAVAGMVVAWWRRPGWKPMLLHAGLAYLVLTLVFYAPRFFLYLLPFYLSGTFGLLLATRMGGEGGAIDRPALRLGIAALLLALSAAVTAAEVRRMLADPPDETRVAGEWLRAIGHPGERIMARKPHVAWFADMEYVPIPYTERLDDLLVEARKARTDYLFVSGTETGLMPQLAVLADPGVALPGLTPMVHRVLRERHFLAVYRVDPSSASRAVFEDSLLAAIRRFAARRPGQAWPMTYLGGHLVSMERYREALAPLAEAERLDPSDALTARFQAIAFVELGEPERAAAACERALALVPGGAWERGYLGEIRLGQGRYAEARESLRRAMELAPTDARYPGLYVAACAGLGNWLEVASAAEHMLKSTPQDATARMFAARAWLALGNPERPGAGDHAGRGDRTGLGALERARRLAGRIAPRAVAAVPAPRRHGSPNPAPAPEDS